MSSSSPADLAVTFRSVARRRKEALGDTDPGAVAPVDAELTATLAHAGALMHTPADADAIASAIEATPADAWDATTLDALRERALDIGRLLRAMAAIADDGEDDDD